MEMRRFRALKVWHTLGIGLVVLGMLIPTACARTVGEHSSWLWGFRVKPPSPPWEAGLGESPFVQQEISAFTDLAYHNPFTGGAILLRARPLWFRYGEFTLEDHARGVYRAFIEVAGNNLRPVKGGRFAPLEEAWQYRDAGEDRGIEIPLKGRVSRPKVDEEAEARRIEEEVLSALDEEKFGSGISRRELRRSLERERARARITQGTRAKIVLILRRAWPSDLLYEFYFIDHDLAYEQDLKVFDRMVDSFEALRK